MKPYLPFVFLLVCGASLVLGVVRLFELRFEQGDVYPEYSSLRSDPLGTMAFYESVGRLPGLTVRRNFSAPNVLPAESQATYFQIATPSGAFLQLTEKTLEEIEQFLMRGNRIVITMSADWAALPQAGDGKRPRIDRWGVGLQILTLGPDAKAAYTPQRVRNESGLPVPAELDWHSGIVLSDLDLAWKRVYARGTDAVLIEREFGLGSLVIATDSYFLSNEAMLRDRHADLLSWLIGPARSVVFDEAHLGVVERPGVAALTRRYRLHWLIGGLILLAGLFVWKNAVTLVPRRAGRESQEYIAGKDAAAGFDSLLRRGISSRDLLAVCFSEWKRSAPQAGGYSAARIRQAEAIFEKEKALAGKDRDPVRTYRAISEILHTKLKRT
jgi:hypothetical protein